MDGVKLTGLWKNTSKKGKTFLAGNLGASRVLILVNDFKEKDQDPDYVLWLAPKKRKDQEEEEL